MVQAAIYQGVAPLVRVMLARDEAALPKRLEQWILLATGGALRSYADLALAASTIERLGRPWVALKGAALANTVYPDPYQRVFADIDLLVSPDDIEMITHALVREGSRVIDRNWTLMASDRRGQVHLRLPSGTLLDLHWSLLNSGQVRDWFPVSTAELLEHCSQARTPVGTQIPVLDPAFQLAHIALHACLSGGHRLAWFVDIDRVIQSGFTQWDDLLRVAAQWRARVAIGAMLFRAHRTLRTPVPAHVLDHLTSHGSRTLVATMDRVAPLGTARTDPGSALVFSALRDTGATTSVPRLNRWLSPKGAARAWTSWRTRKPTLDLMSTRSGKPDDYFRCVASDALGSR